MATHSGIPVFHLHSSTSSCGSRVPTFPFVSVGGPLATSHRCWFWLTLQKGIDWKDNSHSQRPREAGGPRNRVNPRQRWKDSKRDLNNHLTETGCLGHHHWGDTDSIYLRSCCRKGASDWSGLGHTCPLLGEGSLIHCPTTHHLQHRCGGSPWSPENRKQFLVSKNT